jgi:hypothetical protein
MRGEGGCAIGTYAAATDLLIAQFNRGTLKGIYGVDSMHDQRRCSACFHMRKRELGQGVGGGEKSVG